MPRRCTICDHAERTAIDRALVTGGAFRRIAADFSLSESAVRRHANRHVPKLLSEAAEEREAEERLSAGELLDGLRRLYARAEAILDRAEEEDDALALRAVAELRQISAVGFRGVETATLEERLDALEATLSDTRAKRSA